MPTVKPWLPLSVHPAEEMTHAKPYSTMLLQVRMTDVEFLLGVVLVISSCKKVLHHMSFSLCPDDASLKTACMAVGPICRGNRLTESCRDDRFRAAGRWFISTCQSPPPNLSLTVEKALCLVLSLWKVAIWYWALQM